MSPVGRNAPAIFDAWLPYRYKEVIDDSDSRGLSWLAPTWVGEHRARLQAYKMLQGYRDNAARLFFDLTTPEEWAAMQKRREYGDAALLIETARSCVMGEDYSILVAGADDDKNAAAKKRQEDFDQWAEDDNFATTLVEVERDGTTFGDGLYTVEWDSDRQRARVVPHDPDSYFPVLDDVSPGDYPTKVHIAWELTEAEAKRKHNVDRGVTIIHRITYELVPVGEVGLKPYKLKYEPKPADKVCVMTEAEYKASGVRGPNDLTDPIWTRTDAEGREYNRLPLMVDFIPVVHVPNTVAKKNHFGWSVVIFVLQLLDDLHSVDSDVQASSDLTGNPLLFTTLMGNQQKVGPGAHFDGPEKATAEFLSGAEGLEALTKVRDGHLDRLATNSRITAAAQGRVDPAKIEAGIILSLTFGPLKNFVNEMRLARKDPYRILFRFIQRYMIINEVWEGDVIDTDIAWGSYLPNDLTGIITTVTAAVKGGTMSLETAIRMMMEAGVPIDNIAEEIERIEKRDFEGATQLLDATGNDDEVEDYLGRKVARQPVPETLQQFEGGQQTPNQKQNPDDDDNQSTQQ